MKIYVKVPVDMTKEEILEDLVHNYATDEGRAKIRMFYYDKNCSESYKFKFCTSAEEAEAKIIEKPYGYEGLMKVVALDVNLS